jgi:5-deoxy-glucuronate isomerase
VFENCITPYSNLSLGEVVNFPGRWSSYPPHHHPQPEVYYYRIQPSQGFALGCEGDDAYVIRDRDTLLIRGDAVHPQTVAPGYAMCYFWVIPNTPVVWKGERKSFEKDDWLLDKDAAIWPDK